MTTYGQLTILAPTERPKYFLCRCSCGTEKTVRIDHLRTGKTRSCGCLNRKAASERAKAGVMSKANTVHGMCRSRAYSIWCGMHQRCRNPNHRAFKHYGGRGIVVCARWSRFENFLADMGEPPEGFEIERKDNNGPYAPTNCRWASHTDQMNNRRTSRVLRVNGVAKTAAMWARDLGVGHSTIGGRLDAGWSTAEAVSLPQTRNLSGLALGGRANGDRQLAKTHCKNGHPFDEANTYFNGKQRVCRACKRERARAG